MTEVIDDKAARRRLMFLLGSWPLVGAGCALRPPDVELPIPPADHVVPFSQSFADGGLPQGWEVYRARRDLPLSEYFTAEDAGRTVLRARSLDGASALRCPLQVDPAVTPWIDWSWRASAVPAGARVDDLDLDDSPARIALAFDGDISRLPLRDRLFFEQVELFTGTQLPYAILVYLWDATLPADQVVNYSRSGRIRNLVVDSGTHGVGRWLQHRRHIVDDFQRVFGEPPGRLLSVSVLTDADDLKQPLQTDYGDISLSAT